ncbi:MAG: ComEC/Rec2 family competence protein [Brevundimonas sp.]|uniref:ComEC/Rec2 family competence protein n=1 Tax=Brevundimonas sp. TaxID=1871086 RepID=UPI00391B4A3B
MPSLVQRLAAWLSGQVARQSDRWRLWTPVALGGGAATWFALSVEPPGWPLTLAALIAVVGWLVARRRGAPRAVTLLLLLVAALASGLALADGRSARVAAPVAPAMGGPVWIEGWVVDVEGPGTSGAARILLAPVRISGLSPEATPVRVRLTLRDGAPPPPGTAIRVPALLNPPPGPASPGAYDFGRVAWFQGLGGVAYGLALPRSASLSPPPARLRLEMWINARRYALAERIVARVSLPAGGVAAAMVTGHETWLDPQEVETMRVSGLAHILSISGLHMAVVGGFSFFLARLLIAACPPLALRINGKKAAATFGLAAVGAYLVVSGAPPPAERAAITASIAFLAILLDRKAISMHALAVAAVAVLALQPEAIVTPGFQMSFAATAALVALAEAWPRRSAEISVPLPIAIVQRAGSWLLIALMASLVAGAATGPFAMQHFNRTAMFGLLANLIVAPLSDFLIMPMLALGAVLEPLGLGAPFLWAAGVGIDAMLAVGGWIAGLPGAVVTIPSAATAALPCAFLGVLFICLWRGPLRWAGLPLACAVLLWPRAQTPDLWISEGVGAAAIVAEGQASLARGAPGSFAVDVWSRRRGVEIEPRDPALWVCDRTSCLPSGGGPLALSWARRAPTAARLAELCAAAEVVAVRAVVTALPADCDGRLVLDGGDWARGGAVELWRAPDGWRALRVADLRGDRPWSRAPEAQ